MPEKNVQNVSHYGAKMLMEGGAKLSFEAILLNGSLVYRARIDVPGTETVYRPVTQKVLEVRYFKSLKSITTYVTELDPKAQVLTLPLKPVEEINTD